MQFSQFLADYLQLEVLHGEGYYSETICFGQLKIVLEVSIYKTVVFQ